jgi:ethanolamine transporter EutH
VEERPSGAEGPSDLAGAGPIVRTICQFLARIAKICKLLKKIRYWSMMKEFHGRAKVIMAVLDVCSAVL